MKRGRKMVDVYLVRHCETFANQKVTFAGWTDYDVTEKGQKQLDALAERMKSVHFDKIYSSHLIRARKTADAMNTGSDAPIEIKDAFLEIYMGDLEDHPVAEMSGEPRRRWFEELYNFEAPGGESMDDVAKRAWNGLMEVVRENEGKTVGIATHGGAILNLWRLLLRLPREEIGKIKWSGNTAVYRVRFTDEEHWEILMENDDSHLSDDLRSESIESWK